MGTKIPPQGLTKAELQEWFNDHARYSEDAPEDSKYYVTDPRTSSANLYSDDTRELCTRFQDLYYGKTHLYWTNCTMFPESGEDFDKLVAMIEHKYEREVQYKTLKRHCVQLELWESLMSYESLARNGLTLKGDYHVRYHKSVYDNMVAYYIVHSGIEHIWLPEEYVEWAKEKTKIVSPVGDVRTAGIRPTSRLTS